MRDGEGIELLEVILKRNELIDLLSAEALDKASIVRRLDISRSTVNRALSTLEAHGLVERVEGTYRTSQVGSLANEQFDRTVSTLDGVVAARPLLDNAGDFDAPVSMFRNATIVTPDGETVGPIRQLTDYFVGAQRIHSVGGIFRRTAPRAVQDHTAVDDFELSMAISRETFDYANAYFNEEVRRIVEADRHEVRLLETQPSVTVALFSTDDGGETSERAVVVFYNDQAEPVGFVESTDRRCREWAWAEFERAWAASKPANVYLEASDE